MTRRADPSANTAGSAAGETGADASRAPGSPVSIAATAARTRTACGPHGSIRNTS
jgi:hypothetical protein